MLDAAGTASLPDAKITQVISNRKNAFGLQRAAKHGVPTTIFNLKSWTTKTGKSRSQYDQVLARKVLLGGLGRSAESVQGQEDEEGGAKGKEKEKAEENQSSSSSTIITETDNLSRSDLPDLIILAGFMHILSPSFLEIISKGQGKGKEIPCINLHPALPGQFDGAEAIERAFKAFENGTLENDTTGAMVHKVVAEVDRGRPVVIEEIKLNKDESLESLKERIHEVEHRIIVEGARKVLEEQEKQE